MSKCADAVIVGGGIQGLCCAYYLAKKGMKVIVMEKGDLADGTTSRSDGDCFVSDTNPGYMTHFAAAAIEEVAVLAGQLDYDIDWIERGCVLLAETEEEFEIARQQYRAKIADGIEVRLMDKKDVHEDEPNTAPDIAGGLEFKRGSSLNPMLFAYGIGEAIKKMGGELLRFAPVTGVEKDETGSISRVLSHGLEVVTKNVILAAGIWSSPIAAMAGVELPVTAMKGDLLIVEPDVYITRRKTMEIGYNLVRNESGGNVRQISRFMQDHGIGFLIEPTKAQNAIIGFSKYPGNTAISNNLVTRAMAKRAIRFFPVLKDMNIIRSYAGLRPWTPDHEPIVSETAVPGFYVSTGHCGNGIMYGPISGRLMADMVCRAPCEIDVSRLSIKRFKRESEDGV